MGEGRVESGTETENNAGAIVEQLPGCDGMTDAHGSASVAVTGR